MIGPECGLSMPHSGGSAAVADDSPVAERENGSHTAAFEGEPGVPNGVNAAMNAVQTPGLRRGERCSDAPMPRARSCAR